MSAAAIKPQPQNVELVSRQHACGELSIGARRLRQLIDAGRIGVVDGMITTGSLHRELVLRKKAATAQRQWKGKSGNRTEQAQLLKKGEQMHVDKKTISGQHGRVSVTPFSERTRPGAELLPLSRAANMAGVSEKILKREIDLGRLPAIRLGERWRVNSEVLREWARGEFWGVTTL